ncbi:hypothetical protein [Alicyclobacillus sp. SO9]|uniref:hypothetical protein n=1 Tax=Alicyclobacillus sp. SO9 TaxID=2665646 RepID=UPI0018E71DE1|nr:hypothetical protein [Alicyclobacillus sp. SO9]QQE80928.1 hypothetical protein GI364_11385 [Alicyclobacillus sp. SO9]
MTAAYTGAAAIAAALRLQPDTTLSSAASSTTQTIEIAANQVASGNGLYPGMYLALDYFNPAVAETVQITGAITGTGPYTVPVTALVNDHVVGAPVKEVSAIESVADAGSRLWDDACFTEPGAFAYQTVTETARGIAMTNGNILIQVKGRNVTSVSSLTWQYGPGDTAFTVEPSQCEFDDYQITAWGPSTTSTPGFNGSVPAPYAKHLIVNVTYTSGYNPLPADIVRASTVLAARLFKEGDTGFSDVTANAELGMLQFKKGIPTDVAIMAKRWRRWT